MTCECGKPDCPSKHGINLHPVAPPLPEAVREQIVRLRTTTEADTVYWPRIRELLRDAADTIEQLEAAVQQERARLGPIRVTEHLPEDGQRVLIWMPQWLGGYWRETKFINARMPGAFFEGYYGPEAEWWMPMPDEPSEASHTGGPMTCDCGKPDCPSNHGINLHPVAPQLPEAVREAVETAIAYLFSPSNHEGRGNARKVAIVAAEAAAQQERALEGWQPIETAPSGTMILICSMKAEQARDWCFVDWLSGGRPVNSPKRSMTHWRHLPSPPPTPEDR